MCIYVYMCIHIHIYIYIHICIFTFLEAGDDRLAPPLPSSSESSALRIGDEVGEPNDRHRLPEM